MKKDDQIELELNLEPLETEKKEDDIVVKEIEDAPSGELSVEDGINELKFKLEEEKKAREEAERRYKEAQQQAHLAKNDAFDSNLRLLDNAIETVQRNALILEQNLSDAMAAGDYQTAAKIQADMTKSELDLRQLQQGKQQYEAQAAAAQEPADPVEKIASRLTPRSAEWVRAHPEYATDPALTRRMVRAHEDAVDEGIKADTDEYFEFVETKLKIRKPEKQEEQETALSEASAPTQRRSAPPAAPVSRASSSGSRSNVVTLTRAERETAAALGMTDREYASNKQALIKEGKLAG